MQEMKNSQQEHRNMENKAMEMELKLKGLEELISTLKDAKGAQKVKHCFSSIFPKELYNNFKFLTCAYMKNS